MTRVRTPVTVEVGWADPAVDVSAGVVFGSVSHGSRESNPERSTVSVARGRLVMEGDRWAPGKSSAYSESVLSRRASCKVSIGGTTLWVGWIEGPRVDDRAGLTRTTYRLVGLLDTVARNRVDLASSTTDATTDATLWGEATGAVPRLLGASGAGITFAPFTYKGRALEFASLISQVTGRLAGEDKHGRLAMPTYGRLPSSGEVTVENSNYLVRAVETEQLVGTVRNRITIPFAVEPVERRLGIDRRFVPPSTQPTLTPRSTNYPYANMSPSSQQVDLQLPAPLQGTTYSDIQAEVVSATANVLSRLLVNRDGQVSAQTQDLDISSAVTITQLGLAGERNYRVTVDVDGTDTIDWLWVLSERPRSGGTSTTNVFARNIPIGRFYPIRQDGSTIFYVGSHWATAIISVEVVFRLAYTSTHQPADSQSFNNGASQGSWGIREVFWPVWVATTGLGTGGANRRRIEADLADLAQPRTYHDVTLPLWQDTVARRNTIAGLDYGSYLDLGLVDARQGVNISDKVVVAERTVSWGARQVPTVRLRCLHTGEAGTPPPVAAPGVPTSLRLAAGDNAFTASWQAPTSGGEVASYELDWRLNTATLWTSVTGITGASREVTGLAVNTRYAARVRARNSGGVSAWTGIARVTTNPPPATPPGRPRNLTFTTASRTVDVTWDPPNSGGIPTHYRLQSGSSTAYGDEDRVSSLIRTWQYDRLTNGQPWYVRVRAENDDGDSGWVAGSATPMANPPGPPRSLTATPANGKVDLAWVAPNTGGSVTWYVIDFGTSTSYGTTRTISGSTLTYEVTGLTNDTEYFFRVRARNTDGFSTGVTASATPAANPPGPPRSLSVDEGDTMLTLTWQAPATGGAVSLYRIQWGTTTAYGSEQTTTRAVRTLVLPNLTNDTEYFVRVRAENDDGESAWVTDSGTPEEPPPSPYAPPRNLRAHGEAIGTGARAWSRVQWDAPDMSSLPPRTSLSQYQVEFKFGSGNWTGRHARSANNRVSAFRQTGLTYQARVRALYTHRDEMGNATQHLSEWHTANINFATFFASARAPLTLEELPLTLQDALLTPTEVRT